MKKDNPLTKKLVELLEENGAKIIDVTPKKFPSKELKEFVKNNLKKVKQIFEDDGKYHYFYSNQEGDIENGDDNAYFKPPNSKELEYFKPSQMRTYLKKVKITKTIEEKRLEKINRIFEEIKKNPFKLHPELRKAIFEGKVPICTGCGFLLKQEKTKLLNGLWYCDNPKCKRDKNIRMSIG